MNKLVKVGSIVFENGKPVARLVHGAWYKEKSRQRRGLELVPIDDDKACRLYDSIPDSRDATLSDGNELEAVGLAREALKGSSSQTFNLVSEAIEDGFKDGICKYGSFDAESEIRDLREWIRTKIRNTMVLCSMQMVITRGTPDYGEFKNTFVVLAKLWMRLREQ